MSTLTDAAGLATTRNAAERLRPGRSVIARPCLDPGVFRGIAIGTLFAIPLWGALGLGIEWIVSAG